MPILRPLEGLCLMGLFWNTFCSTIMLGGVIRCEPRVFKVLAEFAYIEFLRMMGLELELFQVKFVHFND